MGNSLCGDSFGIHGFGMYFPHIYCSLRRPIRFTRPLGNNDGRDATEGTRVGCKGSQTGGNGT